MTTTETVFHEHFNDSRKPTVVRVWVNWMDAKKVDMSGWSEEKKQALKLAIYQPMECQGVARVSLNHRTLGPVSVEIKSSVFGSVSCVTCNWESDPARVQQKRGLEQACLWELWELAEAFGFKWPAKLRNRQHD